jgi:Sec-independent protein translocase protein TatA
LDTLCGIGLPEIIIIALVGFVLIGPERSQEVALRAGRFLRTLMRSSWWQDFNQVATAIRDLPNTLVRMAELEEAQADLRRTMTEIEDDITIDPPPNMIGRPDAITDPWGIRNASAQTQFTPRTPPPSEAAESDSPPADPPTPPETDHAANL